MHGELSGVGVEQDCEPDNPQKFQTQIPVGARLTVNLNVYTGQGLTQQEVVRHVINKKVHDQ